jgi:hypothetical protein
MKLIMLFALFSGLGIILAAGCIAPTDKATLNTTYRSTLNSSSNTTVSGGNATPNSTPLLKGSLVVSATGFSYPSNLSVSLDNETVGMVNPTSPLYLRVPEGNHTVSICADFVCEQENVTIRFGKYMTIDFSERLQKDVVIMQPTARVLKCYKNGNDLTVDIEFINPSHKDYEMSGVISCGYSYINDRTGLKMGDSTQGTFVQKVSAGQRITKSLSLYLGDGNSLTYSQPVIEELRVK